MTKKTIVDERYLKAERSRNKVFCKPQLIFKMKFPLLLFFCACMNSAFAQTELSKTPNAVDTIRYNKSVSKFYVKNKRVNSFDLKPYLNRFEGSALEFRKFKSLETPAILIILTGLTAGTIGIIKGTKGLANPYTLTLFAGDLIGIPLTLLAQKHLKKAVRAYNRSAQL
jgi:hypothetical protein